jgi:hypothetical protein
VTPVGGLFPVVDQHQEIAMTVRTFALALGILYLALGLLGFVPSLLTPLAQSASPLGVTAFEGYLFALFAVNFFVNLMHMATGAWGIAASRAAGGARAYAKTIAVIYGILAVMGTMPQLKTLFGLMPLYGKAVWLHAGTAVVAAFFGWVWKRAPLAARKPLLH